MRCDAPGDSPLGVSPAEIARVDAWLRAVHARTALVEDPGIGHLVVTPLGFPGREWLWNTLRGAGIALLGRWCVPSWATVSSALYVRRTGPGALARAVRFERAWETLFPGGTAEAWAVEPASFALLAAVKHVIRSELRHVRIPLDGAARGAVLHPFHVADRSDRADEARRLIAAVSLVSPARVPITALAITRPT